MIPIILAISSLNCSIPEQEHVPLYKEIERQEALLDAMKALFHELNGYSYDYWKDYIEWEDDYIDSWEKWLKERP